MNSERYAFIGGISLIIGFFVLFFNMVVRTVPQSIAYLVAALFLFGIFCILVWWFK